MALTHAANAANEEIRRFGGTVRNLPVKCATPRVPEMKERSSPKPRRRSYWPIFGAPATVWGMLLVARSRLARDLEELGLGPGAVAMVHCRMSALGWVVGGAQTVVPALLDALGPDRTLMAYTRWQDEARSSRRVPGRAHEVASEGIASVLMDCVTRRTHTSGREAKARRERPSFSASKCPARRATPRSMSAGQALV